MKVYSTVAVAARCAAACGKRVGDSFVRDSYREMYGLPPMGIGHKLQLTEAQARIVVAYAIEWHGSSSAPGIVAWAGQRGHEIPGLRKSLLPVRGAAAPKADPEHISHTSIQEALRRGESAAPAPGSVTEKIVADLARDVQELKEAMAKLAPIQQAKRLTDSRVIDFDAKRQRIVKLVKGWARDRTAAVSYEAVWSEVYRAFWRLVGEQPEEWARSQLVSERKLDFFATYGYMGVLADSLPGILTALSSAFPIDRAPAAAQRDLGL